MLNWPLPVRILINYRCENLIKMIAICASHVGPQYLRPPVALDAVLHIARIEYKVGFSPSDAH